MRALSLLSLVLAAAKAQTDDQAKGQATYDYVVVGSGPGGGPLAANLARAGHSTVLIDAGSDQTANTNVSLVFNFAKSWNDPETIWDFWVKHSEDPARELKYEHLTYMQTNGEFYVGQNPPPGAKLLGVWYPRAGTLGGCASHNAGVSFLPLDEDWNKIARMTGDASWNADKMRKYFIKIENNTYLPPGTPGHGFKGYLQQTLYPTPEIGQPNDNTNIFKQLAIATGQDPNDIANLVRRDVNQLGPPRRDEAIGPYGIATHASPELLRSFPGTYVAATLRDPARYPLTFKANSLVTKILFDKNSATPKAIGVEIMEGEAMYSADRRYKPGRKGKTTQIFARKEVIISGGTFNTPQILKLSGIGPRAELQKLKIPVVLDAPGVGENMADNYESSIISLAAHNLTGATAPIAVLVRTPTAPTKDRNVFLMCGVFSHEGFWPTMPTDYGPSEFECAVIHMNPKSQAGYVRLNSADPQERPDINFRFFQTGEDQDLTEMLDSMKLVRKALNEVGGGVKPWNEVHPCPGKNAQCTDAKQKEWIKLQAFGHHATSSCQIGGDSNTMAVLDSKFRVRGVQRLRVVDASAFPVIPGAFPVLPTMMISEKATEDIIAASGSL